MSTQKDRNYKSFDGEQVNVENEVLDPIAAGWPKGSWQDTCKFWHREKLQFTNFEIVSGGTEDGVDMSSRNNGNTFAKFKVAAGDLYVLTLKGSSSENTLIDWVITKPGRFVDIQIGNWSDDDLVKGKPALSKDNVFVNWSRLDGKPVRYAYRYGCKPIWRMNNGGKVKHLWWMSAGITIYWWIKYWIKVLLYEIKTK